MHPFSIYLVIDVYLGHVLTLDSTAQHIKTVPHMAPACCCGFISIKSLPPQVKKADAVYIKERETTLVRALCLQAVCCPLQISDKSGAAQKSGH